MTPGTGPPRDGIALLIKADGLRRAGLLAESLVTLQQAVLLLPQTAELHHDLALTQLMLGQVEAALPSLSRALALNPRHGPANLNMGKALERLGRKGFAAHYRAAVDAMAGSAEAHARLASSLEQVGQRGEALRLYRQAALLSAQGDFDGLIYAARAAFITEDLDAAEQALRAALVLKPQHASARGMLARVQNARGAFSEAEAALEAALVDRPDDVSLYYNLVKTRRIVAADAPLIARMRAAREVPAPALARLNLHHALAKALDDTRDYAGAAEAMRTASAIRAEHYPMDRARLRAETDQTIALFSAAFLARAGHSRSASSVPILVLGLPRSGTTLTERILARHSRVAGAGELGFWSTMGAGLVAGMRADAGANLTQTAAGYLAQLRAAGGDAPHVVDKNPFNYRWALLAHLVFPQARIIHCRRHPGDTALSIMMAALRPQPLFGTSRDDLLFCMDEYRRLMAHARENLPADRFYELDYEKLVAAPETEIAALLAFCGLDFEPACLHPEQDARAVMTASVWQVRQKINDASAGRWRNYMELLTPFIAAEA